MGQQVIIISEDQSMWGPGAAEKLLWETYLPLIGGDLTEWKATGVSVRDGHGTARLVGDQIEFEADAAGLGRGKHTVVVEVALESAQADGTVKTMTRAVEIDVTVKKPVEFVPAYVSELKSDDADAAWQFRRGEAQPFRFDAVGAAESLDSPHSFTGGGPAEVVNIDIDLARSIRDVARETIKGLSDLPGVLKTFVSGLADTIGVTYVAEKAAETFKATAETLKAGWDFAKENVPALRDVEAGGAAVVDAVVSAATTVYDAATDAAHFAVSKVDDLISLGARNITRITETIEEGVSGFFRFFTRLVDRVIDRVGPSEEQLDQIEAARAEVNDEVRDQKEAQNALGAAKALADHLGDKTVDGAAADLTAAEKAKQDAIDALKLAFEGKGRALDKIDTALEKLDADAAADGVGTLANGGVSDFFDSVIDSASTLNPMKLVNNALTSSNFILKAKALIDIEAQAGLKLSAEIDAGSVDTELHYDVTSTVSGNAGLNTYIFDIDAVNANGLTYSAFKTQSPFLTFSADILYEVKGSIDLTFDMLVKTVGTTVIDVPTGTEPFKWSKELSDAGNYSLFTVDSRKLDIEIVPPGLGDILTVSFRFPNVHTTGTKTEDWRDEYDPGEKISFADFVRQSYDDPSLFDLSGLADRLLDLAKPKVGFSEKFQKFMDDAGKSVDVESDGFATALLKALELIVDAAVDIKLRKVDGTTFGDSGPNPYKDGNGYLPIFEVKNRAGSSDGLIHLDLIDNPTFDGDLALLEKLGFFTAKGRTVNAAGEEANFVDVKVDVDQLIATAINVVVLGNTPETTVNPLDLKFSLEDIFGGGKDGDKDTSGGGTKDEVDFDLLEEFLKLEAGVELADLDVNAGAFLSQKFVLAVEDMEYKLLIEGELAGTFSAAGGGEFILPNASSYTDKDGNAQIDYELKLTPRAELFNDTQAGLNFGYRLDLLKEKLEFMAKLPPSALSGILAALGLPTSIEASIGLGPLLRLDGQIDLLTADVFEKAFDFNAGFASITGVLPTLEDRSTFTRGTDDRDVFRGTTGDDRYDALAGNDFVLGGAGDDVLYGSDGNDSLFAGAGNNFLDGEAGDDGLVGGDGTSTLRGGAGNDKFRDGTGADRMEGGEGNDEFLSIVGADILSGGAGNDLFLFYAPQTAGAMDDSPLEFTDFERFDPVTRTGDRLRVSNAGSQAIYFSLDDIEGPDVMVKFAIAPRLTSGQAASDYAALVAGGRQALFRNITAEDLTAALQTEFILV